MKKLVLSFAAAWAALAGASACAQARDSDARWRSLVQRGFDRDSDNRVSRAEFEHYWRDEPGGWAAYDRDGSGIIEGAEFEGVIDAMLGHGRRACDADGDGAFNGAELACANAYFRRSNLRSPEDSPLPVASEPTRPDDS
jgi:hypothetical protein